MPDIVTVRGNREFIALAEHLFARRREEVVCAVRDVDTWSQPRAREALRPRMRQGEVGQARKLFSQAALADERGRAHLGEAAARGMHVRIAATELSRETIIIDRQVMIVAGPYGPAGREYTVTTTPTLVSGMYALFEAAWEAATDLAAFLNGELPLLSPERRAILQALGSGVTDETAARQLSISLRTYRRRVAELLDDLDAGSRFQAGMRAGELGLAR